MNYMKGRKRMPKYYQKKTIYEMERLKKIKQFELKKSEAFYFGL